VTHGFELFYETSLTGIAAAALVEVVCAHVVVDLAGGE